MSSNICQHCVYLLKQRSFFMRFKMTDILNVELLFTLAKDFDSALAKRSIIIMKIKSTHFKKEFDLHKAELIGQGNFAQVYRVFDSQFKDSIAIRKVKKSLADLDDINKEKHINQELRKVDNENILKIFDIIQQQEAVWYITEYCSGGSLWDALNLCKDNKMGERQALECILQISKGVQQLHNHRITHRDLKPQNILLKSKYVIGKPLPLIKLADFGLSTQKIIMETIAGTKQYIAPEQAKFHNYTNAVDVWSLGIIFDQILHGTPFYSGQDNKEVFNKILKMPFKIRDETIRQSIKELLLSLLKKKPYERPIIAVIKSTVQRILEEIDTQIKQKQLETQSQTQKNMKRKSSKQTGGDFSKNSSQAKLNSINNSSKENGASVYSRKVYESGTVEHEQQKFQKTWKSNMAQQLTPQSRQKPNMVREELNNLAKNPTKPEIKDRIATVPYRERVNKAKSIVDDIFTGDKKQKQERIMSKPELKHSHPPIQQKINLYKIDRRKIIASNIKKDEFKSQILDINTYKQKVFNSKKGLMDKTLKVEKILAFLPNTQFAPNDFQQIKGSTDQTITNFKKKYNCLNFFSQTQDYEIKLFKGSNELQANKQKCLNELNQIQKGIKDIFFEQLDNYIDGYVEKVLK